MSEDPFALVIGLAMILIMAVPLCLVGFAAATWAARTLERRDRNLAYVLHDSTDPEAERPRVYSLWCAEVLALGVFFGVLGLVAVAGSTPTPPDYPLLALAGPAALVASLAALLFWPVARSRRRGDDEARTPPVTSLAPRWLLVSIVGGTGALVTGLVAAGVVSTRDPSSGRLLALDAPTVLDWKIGGGGQVVDIVYAPGGVTAPWPGWAWGWPVLLGTLMAAALLTAVVVRIRQPEGPFASGQAAVDAALRYHLGTFTAVLTAVAVALALGSAMVVAGVALASTALMPLPSPSGVRATAEYALREPVHLASWGLRVGGVALLALSGVGVFLAGLWAHQARVGHRAARVVF